MLPELQSRFDAIEQRKEAFLDHLRTLDDTRLRYRPGSGAWSLLQVAQHLVLLERMVFKSVFREPRAGLRRRWWHAIGARMVAFVFRHGFRVPAPSRKVVPVDETSLEETAKDWSELRAQLASFLRTATPERALALGWRHPVSGPLDVYGALDFLATHHDHHLRQVQRIEAGFAASRARSPVMS